MQVSLVEATSLEDFTAPTNHGRSRRQQRKEWKSLGSVGLFFLLVAVLLNATVVLIKEGLVDSDFSSSHRKTSILAMEQDLVRATETISSSLNDGYDMEAMNQDFETYHGSDKGGSFAGNAPEATSKGVLPNKLLPESSLASGSTTIQGNSPQEDESNHDKKIMEDARTTNDIHRPALDNPQPKRHVRGGRPSQPPTAVKSGTSKRTKSATSLPATQAKLEGWTKNKKTPISMKNGQRNGNKVTPSGSAHSNAATSATDSSTQAVQPSMKPKLEGKKEPRKKPSNKESQQLDNKQTTTHDVTRPLSTDETNQTMKCSPWDVDIDNWWQSHPAWEPSEEDTNDTHTCLRPIQDPRRVSFLERVHEIQFPDNIKTGCTLRRKDPKRMAVRKIWAHGFAATLVYRLNEGFWSAYRENRPFRHTIPEDEFRWPYTPPLDSDSWAACPSQDHECYFLPISNCPRPPPDTKEETPKKKYIYHEIAKNETLKEQMIWLSHYLMRPRQELRRRFYEFWKHSNVPKLETPCTWIHARRGDAMTEEGYDRNFYSIQEYLKRGQVKKGENMLLLTDDQAAIEEALLLHPEHKWTYWNRTRYRGATGYNAHFPSDDFALEVLIILAERKLASRCNKGVYGKSNMAKMMTYAMLLEHGSFANFTTIEIDRRLKKTRIEAFDFMKDLEAKLAAAREKLQGDGSLTTNTK
ncbi:expressed unknown protein [Seminavis robusta]|uniref:Uncharacterized protein n=1 Tax=Seminavis robusta TaxID=568900 RepID=A0A9N8ELV9_9STRA|nr:expressed unknown protein [Seminavis robusta]|eukprot:Sro1184_g250130.1 n/a (695) ;mRNA; r:18703-20787